MSVAIPIHRRSFLLAAGAAGAALGAGLGAAYTQNANAADYTLRIAPLRLELAPGKVIDTFGYNGTVPGPLLRLREGRQVSIDIRNDTDIADIIHWHGLYVPSAADGAMEEGSPMVASGRKKHLHARSTRVHVKIQRIPMRLRGDYLIESVGSSATLSLDKMSLVFSK